MRIFSLQSIIAFLSLTCIHRAPMPSSAARSALGLSHERVVAYLLGGTQTGVAKGLQETWIEAVLGSMDPIGQVTMPGAHYTEVYSRDSFWIHLAMTSWAKKHAAGNPRLEKAAIDSLIRRTIKRLASGMSANTGQVPTAVPSGQGGNGHMRDDESTLLFVLHQYLLFRFSGTIETPVSLREAARYLLARHQLQIASLAVVPAAFSSAPLLYEPFKELYTRFVVDAHAAGKYVTFGERHTAHDYLDAPAPLSFADGQTGSFHSWADTFRLYNGTAGPWVSVPQVSAYNQGIYAVALRALLVLQDRLTLFSGADAAELRRMAGLATLAYKDFGKSNSLGEGGLYLASFPNEDPIRSPSLIQAFDSDVSSLTGEALSLYFFDEPILSDETVAATLSGFSRVQTLENGVCEFQGFRVITRRVSMQASEECTVPSINLFIDSIHFYNDSLNQPGNYHNGGSWLLYDALALYAGSRHELSSNASLQLLSARLDAACRPFCVSEEFRSTYPPERIGQYEENRVKYGWNAFAGAFLNDNDW